MEGLVAATVERFGGLEILVVNAGVGSHGPFLDLPVEQMEEMIDTNGKGACTPCAPPSPTCWRATPQIS